MRVWTACLEEKNKHMKRVFTSGSFDLFHIGHLNILEKSAALGDELIVGVSTDELIEEYKGMKPIIPYEQRARIVASIKCVTKVVKQTKLTEIAHRESEVARSARNLEVGWEWGA